jgi:hypothetical protein
MVALDTSAGYSREKVPFRAPFFSVPAAIALTAAGVVVYCLALRNFADNGFRLASQNAWRFGFLVFFAAIMAGPLGRLVPRLRQLEAISCQLFWGFCASYAVYLLSVLVPNTFDPQGAPAVDLFVLFGGGVTLMLALSLTPRMTQIAGGAVRRALLGVSAIYFWLCYTMMGLAYISHPHRPDDFYGWSVNLMILALLVRFADSYRARFRREPDHA